MSKLKSKKLSLTSLILIWMGFGFVLGSIINAIAEPGNAIDSYLVKGVFHVGGALFVKCLKMLVVPLVTFSLISGVCGLKDVRALGRVGLRTFLYYLITTAIAISTALGLASIVRPGVGFSMSKGSSDFNPSEAPSLSQVFIDLIPGNPINAFANGEMLQIIFFSILFGACLLALGPKASKLKDINESLNEVMMKMVDFIMKMAPYGVFCLMAKTFAEQGPSLILPMAKYFFTVIGALLIHLFITMPLILKFYGGLNPIVFLRKMRSAQIFAFSTASSNATIPISLVTAEKKLGIPPSTASFTIPFGATINMDGTAIMQGVATIFIAHVYDIPLGMLDFLTVIGMSVLASIGTAGVPGVGLIMLAMVFHQVGLPVAGIGLILGVDRLLDMLRTAVNISGDAMVSCLVAKKEKNLNEKLFDNPKPEEA